ncbi:MAG: hypothetical protein H0T73_06925 [Ardenticatenales bacterium]|nr:hypothetical protein [Ardenticatenales bacterium]
MRRYLPVGLLLLAFVVITFAQYQTSVTAQQSQPLYIPVTLMQPTHTPVATLVPTVTASPTSGAVTGTGVYKLLRAPSYSSYGGTKLYGFLYFASGMPNTFGGVDGYRPVVCFDGTGCLGQGNPVDNSGYYEFSINGPPAKPITATGYVFIVNGNPAVRVSNNAPIDTRNGTCFRVDFIECAQGDMSSQCTITDQVAGEESQFQLRVSSPDAPLACP